MFSGKEDLALGLFTVQNNIDSRGSLTSLELGALPILPKRLFWISQVPTEVVRGKHFHKKCNQILICTDGEITIQVTDNSKIKKDFSLVKNVGLLLPTLHYVEMRFHTKESGLLVIADQPYDPEDVFTVDEFAG